jgi:hypothetical protein
VKNILPYLILALGVFLSGCGVDFGEGGSLQNQTDTQFSSQQVRLISEPGALRNQNGVLQGTGTSIFRQALRGVNSNASYELEFSLQNGGELVLVSHGDENLNNAFQVRFSRRGYGRGSLLVILQANGGSRSAVNDVGVDVFANVDASRSLRFQVDVHNDDGGAAHVLIWDVTRTRDVFNPYTALLNTNDNRKSNYGSPGRGAGARWGMQLNNASVSRAIVSPGKWLD